MSTPMPDGDNLSTLGAMPIPGQREPAPAPSVEVGPVSLDDLGPGTTSAAPARDLRLLASIPVDVTVELGRVELPLRELITLAEGAVFELDKASDAPVDVLVNGKLVARGEVVVIEGSLGVRVLGVVESPAP